MNKKVKFNYANIQFKFSSKTKLKEHVELIFKHEKIALEEVNYIFCDDAYLLSINQSFLNHDTFTDIITFPLHEKDNPIVGEIYISIERVRDNAKQFATSFETELIRVISHGALHLCGYKDKTKAQQTAMRGKEDEYISLFKTNN
jgi:probable rRNA maturation factor